MGQNQPLISIAEVESEAVFDSNEASSQFIPSSKLGEHTMGDSGSVAAGAKSTN